MKILLDTRVFLWAILEPARLTPAMRSDLIDPDKELLMSVASMWEIGTKYALGKLPLHVTPDLLIPQQMDLPHIVSLPLNMEHALRAHKLPLHHRDPFDRMIIAQALVESIPIMTSDLQFKAYGVALLQ